MAKPSEKLAESLKLLHQLQKQGVTAIQSGRLTRVHTYIDDNGRIGRFLMNVMCASGKYPWIIVPVEKRKRYMSALEKASTQQDIKPFCKFLAELVII